MAFPSASGTLPGDQMLDGPPPSPAFEGSGSTGEPTPAPGQPGPLGQLVPPIGAGQLPPQVLTGILQAGQQMVQAIDSFSQVTPDLAPDWEAVKQSLLNAMAKVLQAGAGPTSSTAPGSNFSGGGIDRGGMPSASGL